MGIGASRQGDGLNQRISRGDGRAYLWIGQRGGKTGRIGTPAIGAATYRRCADGRAIVQTNFTVTSGNCCRNGKNGNVNRIAESRSAGWCTHIFCDHPVIGVHSGRSRLIDRLAKGIRSHVGPGSCGGKPALPLIPERTCPPGGRGCGKLSGGGVKANGRRARNRYNRRIERIVDQDLHAIARNINGARWCADIG